MVEDLRVGEFGEPFVKGAAFVGLGGAEEETHVGGESFVEDGEQGFQRFEHPGGTADGTVGERVGALEPDEFAAEEGQRLERGNGLVNARGGGGGVVSRAVDDLQAEFTRVGRGEFFGERCARRP